MSTIATVSKPKFREYPAKPALLRRRDVTNAFFSHTTEALGVTLTPSEAIALPFPDVHQGVRSFRRDYWIAEMWSKCPFELGIDRKAAAKQSFYEAETRCKATNERLSDGWNRPWTSSIREPLRRAARKLSWLLSDITSDEVCQRAGWGPGVSTSLNSSKCSHQHKWEFAAHATRRTLPWVQGLFDWASLPDREIRVVQGNKVTTVPKNAKTERTIAVEPDWNMFFQRGLGKAIRKRLNRVGLLVGDSQIRNQRLAAAGSSSDSFGTIDLSSASDSVSLALCELLLPPHIFNMMLSLRSNVGSYDGVTASYEKISSMGNGFTFELETAMFWALGESVTAGGVVCYGDDIIVACREDGLRTIELLEFCGFRVNTKKSFLEGPFRESCGGHYFKGVDVTPPYVRKPVDSLTRYISSANALSRRIDWRDTELVARLAESWRFLASSVPRRFRGPTSAGDICLWTPFDMCTPSYHSDWRCFVGQGVRWDRHKADAPEWGRLQAALHGDTHVEEYATPEGVAKVCFWYADRWSDVAPGYKL